MSPVKQTAPRSIVLAVLGAVLGLVGVVALVVFVLDRGTQSGEITVTLGEDHFNAGGAEGRAAAIRAGGPILFTDAAGGSRDIYLQHVGATDTEGWLAFDARRAGTGRDCTLAWDAGAARFTDPCSGTPVPADGAGLVQYPVEVDEGGALIIDIRAGRAG